ncbi:MAG: CBS domain-containing protein [Eudoraea sp.]|nr:CBS domain-containing protein [Eudoraea sp.]
MGELKVKKLSSKSDKLAYIDQILLDIEALDEMLAKEMFEKEPIHIGAEQEFCLTDKNWEPATNADVLLKEINDPHFTSELTLYNLEINLDPLRLEGKCFSTLHKQVKSLLKKAAEVAEKHDTKIILTGILPTVTPEHLGPDYMTPLDRYRVLNDALIDIRQDEIELHIKGVDEVNLHHDNIMYEGCNTSFQSHLQIDPDDFVDSYNWAQAIAGPILSICTNSPLLLGKELWEETRIALFTQSIDTRASTHMLNEKESRVSFGKNWVEGSVSDFYKDTVIGFRSLLTSKFESDSLTELRNGSIPKLKALNLHNGTIYKWNRVCYGVTSDKPHIRIENRYLPSGPTTSDEIANMMLWVGVMMGRPKSFDDIHLKMDFKDAKSNFFNAARYGMRAQFHWDGNLISSQDLLRDHLLPMAFRGLYRMGVAPEDAERYLTIIENRVRSTNGSRWMINALRKLKKSHKTPEALRILVASMHERRNKHYAVDAWQLPRGNEYKSPKSRIKVQDIMTSKMFTAQESDSAELVAKMMDWKKIHHAPILDHYSNLSGILSWTDIKDDVNSPEKLKQSISDLMNSDLITVGPDTPKEEAEALMRENNIHCLPVVVDKKLIGIVTSNDI